LFSVVLSSCDEGDDDSSPLSTDASATYKLEMNGNTVAEGTSTNKVMQFGTTVNMGGTGSELVVIITNVPVSVGGTIEINQSSGTDGGNCQLTISGTDLIKDGEDEIYWGISGTVTRTSETKLSFTGICKEDASATITHSFSGYVESDAYKVN
ncbi:MAG: hypothetical protein PF541_16470, partial [Prolixibacteraceae bacterium]|nr:hypothetical protein [Prolixibacteraceae bacterium]